MISVKLPYSKNNFKIKKVSFEQILDISRILHDGTAKDLIDYLEEFLCIEDLTVIDKFFVLAKAREMFINHTISLTAKDNNLTKIDLSMLIERLVDHPQLSNTLITDDITFDLDIPHKFVYEDGKSSIYDTVIKSIKYKDAYIDVSKLADEYRDAIFEQLPPKFFKVIKEYIESLNLTITLFDGRESLGLEPIVVNFLTSDPVHIIKALYSEYDVQTCRDIIFHLSQKIGEATLFKSTMVDVTMYIEEISSQKARATGSNSVLEL